MIILDTNVVSEMMRNGGSIEVSSWYSAQSFDELHLTSVSVAEILYGIEILPQGKRRESLRAGADLMFTKVFDARILAFTAESARAFSTIAAKRRQQGRPIAEFDAQIAAIALIHGATLATRNIADFEDCGVRVVNPWVG
jgi:predicted nucleic acid-binding protein